jgi:hypothetical protein
MCQPAERRKQLSCRISASASVSWLSEGRHGLCIHGAEEPVPAGRNRERARVDAAHEVDGIQGERDPRVVNQRQSFQTKLSHFDQLEIPSKGKLQFACSWRRSSEVTEQKSRILPLVKVAAYLAIVLSLLLRSDPQVLITKPQRSSRLASRSLARNSCIRR